MATNTENQLALAIAGVYCVNTSTKRALDMSKTVIDRHAVRTSTDEEANAITFANQWAIEMQGYDNLADRYLQVCASMANIAIFDVVGSGLMEINVTGPATSMEEVMETEDALWLTLTNHRAAMAKAILESVGE